MCKREKNLKHEIVNYCFFHISGTDRTAYLRLKLIQDHFFSSKLIITEISSDVKSIVNRRFEFQSCEFPSSQAHFVALHFFPFVWFFVFGLSAVIIKANEDICDMFDINVPVLSGNDLIYLNFISLCARASASVFIFSVPSRCSCSSSFICKIDARNHLSKFLNNVRNAMTSTIWKFQFHLFAQFFSLLCICFPSTRNHKNVCWNQTYGKVKKKNHSREKKNDVCVCVNWN